MKAVSKNQNENQNLPANIQPQNLVPSNAPSYLQKYDAPQGSVPDSLSNLARYWVPPRLKIVQAQSGDQYKDFEVGDVLLVPQMTLIAKNNQPFWITPIFMAVEFCVWNPYGLKGQLPVIRDRSTDPDSNIAKRARSKNKDSWYDFCPEAPPAKKDDPQFKLRYCEHINYYCTLSFNNNQPDHPANSYARTPFVISFHHAGFYDGQNLCTLVLSRRKQSYADIFECRTVDRSNNLGKWKGLQIANPSLDSKMPAFVEDEQEFLDYKALYDSIQSKFDSDSIRVDYEDDAAELAASSVPDSKGKF